MREDEQRERQEAVDRQQRPYTEMDVNQIKDLIKERTGKKPRFTGKDQLVDILLTLDQEKENVAGMCEILNKIAFTHKARNVH